MYLRLLESRARAAFTCPTLRRLPPRLCRSPHTGVFPALVLLARCVAWIDGPRTPDAGAVPGGRPPFPLRLGRTRTRPCGEAAVAAAPQQSSLSDELKHLGSRRLSMGTSYLHPGPIFARAQPENGCRAPLTQPFERYGLNGSTGTWNSSCYLRLHHDRQGARDRHQARRVRVAERRRAPAPRWLITATSSARSASHRINVRYRQTLLGVAWAIAPAAADDDDLHHRLLPARADARATAAPYRALRLHRAAALDVLLARRSPTPRTRSSVTRS